MSSGNQDRASENSGNGKPGDERALRDLLERHLPWIERHVHNRLGARIRRRAETLDIVQDAMVQFLNYGPRFEMADENQFRALICRIVENVLRDTSDRLNALRRRISLERPLPPDTVLNLSAAKPAVDQPSKEIQRQESEAWIRLGIELLNPEDREVIILRAYGSLTFGEIGADVGISENTARMRYERALPRLAEKVSRLRRGDLDGVLRNSHGQAES